MNENLTFFKRHFRNWKEHRLLVQDNGFQGQFRYHYRRHYEQSCNLENKNCRPVFADILELWFLCDYDVVLTMTKNPHLLEIHSEIFMDEMI